MKLDTNKNILIVGLGLMGGSGIVAYLLAAVIIPNSEIIV